MSQHIYDFLVLGGGSAGYAAARTAVSHGMKTAVIDGADELGGLCILRGCMPSKTLIESANRCRTIRRAEEFGLRAGNAEVRGEEIIARKRRLIADFAGYRQEQLESGKFDLIRGTASFSGKNTVTVALREGGEQEIGFGAAVVATGSKVTRVPVDGLEETGYWTSRDVLEAEAIPESVTVLGGGAIALEMACYFEGLGKQVTVIQRSEQVLTGSDRDVADALAEAMNSRPNLTVFTGTKLKKVFRDSASGKKIVVFEHRGKETEVASDEIVQALGRRANTDGLRADAAGIALKPDGKVECSTDQRCTGAPHLFAAGDVCGPYEIVHVAIEQGEIAADNAAIHLGFSDGAPRVIDYRLILYGIFTHPEVAMVGMNEADARASGRPFATATYPFDDHGKSMVMGETEGFVKMIADTENGEILGAAVVGPDAVGLIHEVAVAMHFRCTTDEFLRIPHYHPTLSEIWTYPAEDLSISG